MTDYQRFALLADLICLHLGNSCESPALIAGDWRGRASCQDMQVSILQQTIGWMATMASNRPWTPLQSDRHRAWRACYSAIYTAVGYIP
jgi:hypothetical protein